jgi:hypothetical protein
VVVDTSAQSFAAHGYEQRKASKMNLTLQHRNIDFDSKTQGLLPSAWNLRRLLGWKNDEGFAGFLARHSLFLDTDLDLLSGLAAPKGSYKTG